MDRKERGGILIRGEGEEKGKDIQMKRREWERNWKTERGKRRRNGRKEEIQDGRGGKEEKLRERRETKWRERGQSGGEGNTDARQREKMEKEEEEEACDGRPREDKGEGKY